MTAHNAYPKVHGSNVVWQERVGDDFEIVLPDETETIQLTNDAYNDINPQVIVPYSV